MKITTIIGARPQFIKAAAVRKHLLNQKVLKKLLSIQDSILTHQ
jgi:UDP-N-acetylglucosamine 2-epimerase